MRILKLSLILKIDEELTEIFKVKDKGQFSTKKILKTTLSESTILANFLNAIATLASGSVPLLS